MRAAIDYAMHKANTEIVHSGSRESGLKFNANPLLREESSRMNNAVLNTWELIRQHNVIAGNEDYDTYGFEFNDVQNSKFGNCDNFSYKIK